MLYHCSVVVDEILFDLGIESDISASKNSSATQNALQVPIIFHFINLAFDPNGLWRRNVNIVQLEW